MTPKWTDFEAGPGFDCIIAECIGLQWRTQPPWTDWNTTGDIMYCAAIRGVWQTEWHSRESDCIPRFSTDLNAAWSLLSLLKANIEITLKNGPNGELLIAFWDKVWFSNYSAPAALSICYAVLDWRDAQQAARLINVNQ